MKKIENVYMLLPRFVPEAEVNYERERYLSALFRNFERNGMRFTFIIEPASIYNPRTGTKHYFPGEREELVESVLRRMAIDENPNFIKEDLVLMFNLQCFLDYLAQFCKERLYPSDEIELSLEILASTQYELRKGPTELSFHAIEELRRVTKDEEIFYYARFSYMFLGGNKIFDHSFGGANPNKSRSAE